MKYIIQRFNLIDVVEVRSYNCPRIEAYEIAKEALKLIGKIKKDIPDEFKLIGKTRYVFQGVKLEIIV